MSTTVINTLVSESRSVPRIWIEGNRLIHGGIEIGVQYVMNVSSQLRRIELRPAPEGFAGKTICVSKRTRNDRVYPLIEVRDAVINELFKVGTKLRVAINKGRIVISMSHISMRVQERVSRFLDKIKNNQPLSVVSVFHGGGVLDKAIHHGMQRSKVASFVKVAVELEGDYIDSSLRNNPELFNEESIVINGDIRDVNILGSGIPQSDMLIGGVPCTGASKSGASKLGLNCAEEHSTAGALFHDYLDWVKVMNPAIVVLENVGEYKNTAAMIVIRSVLTHLGYEVRESVLDGPSLGSLEKRRRLCMIATTPGACDPIDFEQLVSVRQKEEKLSDVLEFFPADCTSWKSYDYLASKEERDKASGKGFARQLLTGEEDGCGTIGRGYAKARSTEPFIVAPHDPSLSRLMTPGEHARVKTIPESLIEGLSATIAHEVLGQSVIFSVFVAVGELIAKTILGLAKSLAPANAAPKVQAAPVAMKEPAPAKREQSTPATLPLFALIA
ncbi:DNA cytosine methyltransferase [Pseudomonas tritici]|uniref:DNA cytosine methyltransferase n=1 Tax=Pseudomonas tritici TaxID=2745518 RepID=UPI00387B4EAA